MPSLPAPLWPGVVAPDRSLSMGQIERSTHIHTHSHKHTDLFIYIYIYIRMYVCSYFKFTVLTPN